MTAAIPSCAPALLAAASLPRPPQAAARSLAAALLAEGVELVDAGADVDFEDWVEDALRTLHLRRAARERGLVVLPTLPASGCAIDCRTHAPRRERLVRAPDVRVVRAPDIIDYAASPAFLANAARRVLRCRNDEDGDPALPSLSDGLAQLRAEGFGDVVWKQTSGAPKSYPLAIIPAGAGIDADIGLAAVHMGGSSLLQERVDMTDETRFFVVDGAVVSGAPCVCEHTPLDRDALARHGALASDSPYAPALAERARDIAEALAAEGVRDCVLDLYRNAATGEIGVVELNPINASGLYANDPAAIFPALVDSLLKQAVAPDA